MTRTTRYKALYVLTIVLPAGAAVACVAGVPYEQRLRAVIVAAVLLLVPGRIVGFAWRGFFRGRHLQTLGQWRDAQRSFESFLGRVRRRPGLKRLIWLTSGVYTRDVEVMTLGNLGVCRTMLGEFWEAEQYLLAARELDAQNPLVPYNLAHVAYLRGDKGEAEALLSQAGALGYEWTAIDRMIHRSGELLAWAETRGTGGVSNEPAQHPPPVQ